MLVVHQELVVLVPGFESDLVLEVQEEVAVVEYLEVELEVVLVDELQEEGWTDL